MDGASNAFVRHFRAAVLAAVLTTVSGTGALSNDNCRRLESLARQYAGVQLTSTQQKLKRKMVAWYKKNCGPIRSANIQL